jgi:hypothetical protein
VAHFAHYVKREIAEPTVQPEAPWFADAQPVEQGLQAPAFHVTRAAKGPATRVAPNDTIWLFSQLRASWGALPPALDAKLVVADVQRRGSGPCRFEAGPGSCWFPLFDATETLDALSTVDAEGRERPLLAARTQTVGSALQSMRELASIEPLAQLERTLAERGFDFLSYRLVDGTDNAFHAARTLASAGRPVWWDRWSLPRRLAERREWIHDRALEDYIQGRIRASRRVWGVPSQKYGEPGSYSHREMQLGRRLGTFRMWLRTPEADRRPLMPRRP